MQEAQGLGRLPELPQGAVTDIGETVPGHLLKLWKWSNWAQIGLI